MNDRDLGFAGMVAAGMSPAEAWQVIRDDLLAEPRVLAMLRDMERDPTPAVRAALDYSRQRWAEHGLRAPWDEL
jgi:hypothetical protein